MMMQVESNELLQTWHRIFFWLLIWILFSLKVKIRYSSICICFFPKNSSKLKIIFLLLLFISFLYTYVSTNAFCSFRLSLNKQKKSFLLKTVFIHVEFETWIQIQISDCEYRIPKWERRRTCVHGSKFENGKLKINSFIFLLKLEFENLN